MSFPTLRTGEEDILKVEIRDINEQTFGDLLPECIGCLYWEAPQKFGRDEVGNPRIIRDEATEIKRSWFNRTGGMLGSCGKILYVDGKAAGYVQYAPPRFLEKVTEYTRELFSPSPDGILISCLYIQAGYQGKGLGTKLLKAVIEDLRERGYQILETYSRDDSADNCSGPTVLYQENNFKPVKTKEWGDGSFSLMRLELASRK